MERPVWQRWLRIYAIGGAIITSGVLLFKYTTPTDQQLIDSFSPEVRREYEKQKQLREEEQEQLMKIVQKTAASKDPIWKTGPLSSPWERNNGKDSSNAQGKGGTSDNILDEVRREKAAKAQRDEMEQAKLHLEEIRRDREARESQKPWWKVW